MRTLRSLLMTGRVAALATLHRGDPAVSMVPYALLADLPAFVVHVSRLAAHTADLLAHPAVALLVTSADSAASPLALPRVAIQGIARMCPVDDAMHSAARAAYLAKIPDAEPLFSFGDFSLVLIEPRSARYVAGFGQASSLTATRLAAIMRGEP